MQSTQLFGQRYAECMFDLCLNQFVVTQCWGDFATSFEKTGEGQVLSRLTASSPDPVCPIKHNNLLVSCQLMMYEHFVYFKVPSRHYKVWTWMYNKSSVVKCYELLKQKKFFSSLKPWSKFVATVVWSFKFFRLSTTYLIRNVRKLKVKNAYFINQVSVTTRVKVN